MLITYRPDNQSGFTLVEVMVALAVSGIVMIAIYAAFQSQQRTYLSQEQVAEVQQNVRAAMNRMTDDIRMAGYDPADAATVGFTTATATSVTFTHVINYDGLDNDGADTDGDGTPDGDGNTDEDDELQIVTYSLYDAYADGDMDLGRSIGGATPQPVAENIDGLEFNYLLADGTFSTAPADLSLIRGVQISILARSRRQDESFVDAQSYTTGSGAFWPGPAAANFFNDHFRRRLITKTIYCRNMGL